MGRSILFGKHHAKLGLLGVAIMGAAIAAIPSQAQSPGDIVVVGNSPAEWAQFQSYWNQLLRLSQPVPPGPPLNQPGTAPPPGSFSPSSLDPNAALPELDPQVKQEELMRNLRVNNLRLVPIIKLNGSSEVLGNLTNNNREAVTISSVNFEVVDRSGQLVQTGSAIPQPATVAPGQTVTFTATLNTIPPDGGFQVRLASAPYLIQGGI
ncbi:hypothetical protein GS597_08155 [Synechococcales cyanobacterium C]|uniref:AMIN domain-containing protein n=1 Tax=Petrachloros mirabilis ULC683 TaxID=2781853 RepID=A0A8K2A712_9CYAN|nr:FxLYD domain-containing protein [Petrachloros mirabilis]NCJ06484.1 hypothetical protein [Petrachloros mirabilis ULC683]